MTDSPEAEQLYRAAAGIALGIGLLALVSPKFALRIYGVDPALVTGPGAFGWRLFAVRNVFVGAAALRGERFARDLLLPVQFVDQAVFLHAWRSGGIRGLTTLMAFGSSGAVTALCLKARA